VTYPVRVVLDEGNLAVSISEVREWLNKHGIDPGAFQYRMTAGHVQLRIDFVTLREAARFADAFGGLVFGKNRTTPAEVDIIDAEEGPPEAA
jgi:hypothetical protein